RPRQSSRSWAHSSCYRRPTPTATASPTERRSPPERIRWTPSRIPRRRCPRSGPRASACWRSSCSRAVASACAPARERRALAMTGQPPARPEWVRAVNAGRIAPIADEAKPPLERDALLAEALAKSGRAGVGVAAFGDDGFLEPLDVLCAALE